MSLPVSTPILIVGAGPTGLALAVSLAQAGVDHLLVDALPSAQNASRAAVLHAHTLEALSELGVIEQLTGEGLKIARFVLRAGDRPLARIEFDKLPTKHPYLLMLGQERTEAILAARYAALGGVLHRGVRAARVTQDKKGARAWLETNGETHEIAADYIVGADGMHSVVREGAGIAFDGGAMEQSFVLADVVMDWPLGRGDVSAFVSDDGPLIVVPLPGERFRVVAAVQEAPEHVTGAHVEAILKARGPRQGTIAVRETFWSSRFRIHHRLAQRYRNGRIFLMGDSAHVHSPAGGQGMNTGLVDACVLGRILAAVATRRAPASALDLYDKLRRPAAAEVLRLAGGLTTIATTKNAFARAAALAVLGHAPMIRRRIAYNLSGIARRNAARTPDWRAARGR